MAGINKAGNSNKAGNNKNMSGAEIDVFARELPADLPIHRPMTARVNVDLLVNKDSEVWLLHDAPFPGIVQWAEYDVDMDSLCFVTEDGKTQDLGLRIQPAMRKYLRQGQKIDAVLIKDKKIHDFTRIPLLVRETMN